MDNKDQKLPKSERLSGKYNIDHLFTNGESFVVYPFRIVYAFTTPEYVEAPAAMFVSVPKKRFKRAVKRNFIRRRVKEAYRLNKTVITDLLKENDLHLSFAIIYLDKELREYNVIEPKIREMLRQIKNKVVLKKIAAIGKENDSITSEEIQESQNPETAENQPLN